MNSFNKRFLANCTLVLGGVALLLLVPSMSPNIAESSKTMLNVLGVGTSAVSLTDLSAMVINTLKAKFQRNF